MGIDLDVIRTAETELEFNGQTVKLQVRIDFTIPEYTRFKNEVNERYAERIKAGGDDGDLAYVERLADQTVFYLKGWNLTKGGKDIPIEREYLVEGFPVVLMQAIVMAADELVKNGGLTKKI